MNREIKFRAWFKGNTEQKPAWIQGFNMVNFHSYFNKGLEPEIYRYNTTWKLSEIELMQFTGLKDKNGKEIFEGDIISAHNFYKAYYVIEWNQSSASFFPRLLKYNGFTYGTTWESFICKDEIIGNLFENPDLLK